MFGNDAQVVGGGVIVRLARLGHHVADINLDGLAAVHGVGDPVHQQVRDDTGVNAARPEDNRIGQADRFQRFRQRLGVFGPQVHALDRQRMMRDLRLALDNAAVLHFPQQA